MGKHAAVVLVAVDAPVAEYLHEPGPHHRRIASGRYELWLRFR